MASSWGGNLGKPQASASRGQTTETRKAWPAAQVAPGPPGPGGAGPGRGASPKGPGAPGDTERARPRLGAAGGTWAAAGGSGPGPTRRDCEISQAPEVGWRRKDPARQARHRLKGWQVKAPEAEAEARLGREAQTCWLMVLLNSTHGPAPSSRAKVPMMSRGLRLTGAPSGISCQDLEKENEDELPAQLASDRGPTTSLLDPQGLMRP